MPHQVVLAPAGEGGWHGGGRCGRVPAVGTVPSATCSCQDPCILKVTGHTLLVVGNCNDLPGYARPRGDRHERGCMAYHAHQRHPQPAAAARHALRVWHRAQLVIRVWAGLLLTALRASVVPPAALPRAQAPPHIDGGEQVVVGGCGQDAQGMGRSSWARQSCAACRRCRHAEAA